MVIAINYDSLEYMTNQNEDPQVTAGANNESDKLEWEQKMTQFRAWLVGVRHKFSDLLGDARYASMWNALIFDFFHQTAESTGLGTMEIRRYGIIHKIIDSTVAYESAPNFDLPNGEIETSFRKLVTEKWEELGGEAGLI